MKNIIIVGSGAVAAELTSYIEDNNLHTPNESQLYLKGYIDFHENILKYWSKYKFKMPVLNDIHQYQIQKDDHFILGIADIDFRWKMLDILKIRGANIVGFMHCSALISDSTKLGTGNIIYPYCIIGPNTTIGDYNILTSYSFISHDCKVGNNNFLSTSGLSGNASIGSNNFFGIRSTVLPNISIGNGNKIQAGMIVDKDIADETIFFHRFKEKVIAVKSEEKHGE